MPLFTLNGYPIIQGTVEIPRTSRWVADLQVDAPDASVVSGALALAIGDKLTLAGTALRSGSFVDRVSVRGVGGAGGLLKLLPAKAYQGVPLRIPLQEALAAVSEKLSQTADAAVLNTFLPKWSRIAGPCSEEVRSLMRVTGGAAARVLVDGSLWVGTETWPDSGLRPQDYDVIDDRHWLGEMTLGMEVPTLLPGTTFLERHVEEVTYVFSRDKVRVQVQFAGDPASSTTEPLSTSSANDLADIIDRSLKPQRFMRIWPAQVVKQNGDLSLELKLDSPDVPGLSNVPLRTFAPGVVLKVAPGCRVGVTFEQGDPQKPVAVLWEQAAGTATQLSLNATQIILNGGVLPVARAGDTAGPYPIVGGNPSIKA